MMRHNETRSLTAEEREFINVFAQQVLSRAEEEGWMPRARNLCDRYIVSLTAGNGSVPSGMNPYLQMVVQNIFQRHCNNRPDMNGRFPGQTMPWFSGQ